MNRALILLVLPSLIFGRDFGKEGYSFDVTEKDHLERMKEQMQHFTDVAKTVQLLVKQAANPTAKRDLPNATTYRRFSIDPTFTLPEDTLTKDGTILFKKGTEINPIKFFPLKCPLLFLNGKDPKHFAWAIKEAPPDAFWVIASGDTEEAKKQKTHPIFLDADGSYASSFQVKVLPALVKQVEYLLQVEEIPVNDGFKKKRNAEANSPGVKGL